MLCPSDGQLQPLPTVLANLVIHGQSACFCIFLCVHVCSGTSTPPLVQDAGECSSPSLLTHLRGISSDTWLCQGPGICMYLQVSRTHRGTTGHTTIASHGSNSTRTLGLGKAGKWGSCEVNYFVTCFYDIMILI